MILGDLGSFPPIEYSSTHRFTYKTESQTPSAYSASYIYKTHSSNAASLVVKGVKLRRGRDPEEATRPPLRVDFYRCRVIQQRGQHLIVPALFLLRFDMFVATGLAISLSLVHDFSTSENSDLLIFQNL